MSASNDTATPPALAITGGRLSGCGAGVPAFVIVSVCLQFYKHVANSFLQASQVELLEVGDCVFVFSGGDV